jgi:hypothetical protein
MNEQEKSQAYAAAAAAGQAVSDTPAVPPAVSTPAAPAAPAAPVAAPAPVAPAQPQAPVFPADLQRNLAAMAAAAAPRAIRIRTRGRYRFARLVLALVSLIGWLTVLGGVAIVFFALTGVVGNVSLSAEALVGLGASFQLAGGAAGVGLIVGGLLIVAFAIGARANVDSADYGRQSLHIMKAVAEGRMEVDTSWATDEPAPNRKPA